MSWTPNQSGDVHDDEGNILSGSVELQGHTTIRE